MLQMNAIGAERSLKDEDIIWFYDMAGRAFFAQDSIDKGKNIMSKACVLNAAPPL